jgi:regulator of sigma E protease
MALALIISILILGFLVFIHELAHFIAAKKSNVKVEEFGFGLPPRIWGKKIGETIYSVNWLPFGGFVRLYGEEQDKEIKERNRSFFGQRPSTKAKILLAGVLANFIIGTLIFYIVLGGKNFQAYLPSLFGHKFVVGQQTNYPVIVGIFENSPAKEAGLKEFDLILSANTLSFENAQSFVDFVNKNKGRVLTLEIKNLQDERVREINVIPRENPPKNQGPLGIKISEIAQIKYLSLPEKIFSGFLHSINVLDYSLRVFGNLIKQSYLQKTIKPVAQSISGPVGILVLIQLTLKEGLFSVLNLIALISLALALINILPIPGADGGRMIFVLYEAIAKKPPPAKFERNFNLVGYFLLLLLLGLITIKDIMQFKKILF